MIDFEKIRIEYDLLVAQRTGLKDSAELVNNMKKSIRDFFINNGCINNSIEQNLLVPTSIYIAPVKEIHESRMVCWPFSNRNEIYVDKVFLNEQSSPELTKCQLTHEIIHAMVRKQNGQQYKFGHKIITQQERNENHNIDERDVFTAFDEACTQIVAEEINGYVVDKETDSYYLIKTIIRTITPFIGRKELLDQFCNNNTSFEDKFNMLFNNKFSDFAEILSIIHDLEKELKNNDKLTEQEKRQINEKLRSHVGFISNFVKNSLGVELIKRPEIVDEYNRMNNDDTENHFDSDYNLDGLRKKYEDMRNYIFTKDENGNKIMVDRATNQVINDKRIIDQYRMLFLWIQATRKNRPSNIIPTNTITDEDLKYAFNENAKDVFSQIMYSIESYVTNNIPVDVNQIANSLKKYNYKYSDDILSELFKNENNTKLVTDYFASAYYMDEEIGSKKM